MASNQYLIPCITAMCQATRITFNRKDDTGNGKNMSSSYHLLLYDTLSRKLVPAWSVCLDVSSEVIDFQ